MKHNGGDGATDHGGGRSSPEVELRALFAAIQDIVLVLDAQGRYVNIASADPSLLDKPASEKIGKTVQY